MQEKSQERLVLAPGDDVDRHGLLLLGDRGIRVGIYAQDFVVEEYSWDGFHDTNDVVCVGLVPCCCRDRRWRLRWLADRHGRAGPCDPIGLNSGLNNLRRVLRSDVKSRHVALRLIAVDESLFQQGTYK